MEMIISLHFTFIALWVIFSVSGVLCDICNESYCHCTESEVTCNGENTQSLELSSSPFAFPLVNLSISSGDTVNPGGTQAVHHGEHREGSAGEVLLFLQGNVWTHHTFQDGECDGITKGEWTQF